MIPRETLITLAYRKATIADLPRVIELLLEDELGQTRELHSDQLNECYIKAFELIERDPNQYLMIVEYGDEVVGTCHLTIMPSLTFKGSTRLQIEAVRVAGSHRGRRIGSWMLEQAILYAKAQGCSIVQLTTNKQRVKAKKFYETLGFEPSHEGMKLYVLSI